MVIGKVYEIRRGVSEGLHETMTELKAPGQYCTALTSCVRGGSVALGGSRDIGGVVARQLS